ncbi:MAG TPA: STAS domain-containing protein, partial [Ilumatobacteraceae bacterium]|nr:STAS domain-containing protein [Ilumatobacteraceae bacterium]
MHDLVQVDVRREADLTLLVVSGEIDAATAHLVSSALDDFDTDERIVVDLAAVKFMDSSGLHV